MLNRAVTESLVILVPKAKRILISVHVNKIMADVNNFIAPRSQYTHTETKWLWRCHADLIWNWPKLLFNRRVYDMNRMKLCSVCHLNMLLTFLPARLCVYRPNGSHGWQGSFFPQLFFPSRVWLNRWDHQPKFDLFENVNRLCDSVLGFSHHWKLNTNPNGENAPFFIYLPSSQPRILHE